ncbi:MAG: hypothetical protein JNM43_07185 [Planctomycetaceae bacterium]|nr:hypothetical protein [Planctomycetaceae bacterium]
MASMNEASWQVALEPIRTAQTVIEQWANRRKITVPQKDDLRAELQALHQEYSLQAESGWPAAKLPGLLPIQTQETPGVRGYRAAVFMTHYLNQLRARRRLTLAQYHALQSDTNERLAAVQRLLQREGIDEAVLIAQVPDEVRSIQLGSTENQVASALNSLGAAPASATPPEPPEPPKPRRNIMEILLDPRSIQCLLGLGGVLMVVGLVILLWLNNFFTPQVTAIGMAVINVIVLGAGMQLIRKTRFQMAGKAVALLACAVMPLNLWYCHGNDLVTVDGHLWVAAVLISALYAAAAWVLKDEAFVYVFCGGITLTGLLVLADLPPSPMRFWEIASPATMLVILGLMGVHLERAFMPGSGPFSREKFGMAFFWSGHAQIATGLILLLGAHVGGDWLYEVWFKPVYDSLQAVPSPVCSRLRWLSLILVLAGVWSCIYSDLVVRRRGILIHIAGGLLLWAEILVIQILNLHLGVDAIIGIMAGTACLLHGVRKMAPADSVMTRSFPAFALMLGIVPVFIGFVVYLDNLGARAVWTTESPRWTFAAVMLLTAVANRFGAFVTDPVRSRARTVLFFGTGAATMIAAVAILAAAGLNRWQSHAPLMMLLPLGWLIASRLYGSHPSAQPLWWVAQTAAVVMLLSSLATGFQGFFVKDTGSSVHLALTLFFLEAALFYGLSYWIRQRTWSVYAASLMICAAFWQLLALAGFGTQAYLVSFAVVGLILLAVYRLGVLESTSFASLTEVIFLSAMAALSLAFVSSFFYGLQQLALSNSTTAVIDWGFVGFASAMLVMSIAAFLMTAQAAGRNWFIVTSVGQAVIVAATLHKLIDLGPWQQVELFSVLIGIGLLITGYLGWYREQDSESSYVSVSLPIGALMTTVPLAIATWIDRGHDVFRPLNEFGFLFVSLFLLASGIMSQVKSTTLVGSSMTVLYFLTLLIFVPWSRLNSVALAITIGGGFLFGSGLILAFFRDRLLTLPDRIRNREGVFRVFNWR